MSDFFRYILDSEYRRQIDLEYHVEVIAENTKQLKDCQVSLLKSQASAAANNLAALHDLAQGQEITNAYLGSMAQDVNMMMRGVERLGQGLDQLNTTAEKTLNAIHSLSQTLDEKLNHISQQMFQQQKTLSDIAEILRRPYEAKALELRREADKWLVNGMKATGRDREEDWNDAMRLLRLSVDNPIGMQDYVAWFQIGWLLWKHTQNFAEAEEAFYRSSRLSTQNHDLYFVKSLRHLAYMQYFQQKYTDAYSTIQKALSVSDDYDILYDMARYAAKTGQEKKTLELLDKCIDLRPTTIVTMFAEEDFQ
jgi:tetratricopeptide (TPR) repeat protein